MGGGQEPPSCCSHPRHGQGRGLGQQPLFLRRKAWHRKEHCSSVKVRRPAVMAHGPTAWKPNFS